MIIQLLESGASQNTIAREIHSSKRTVSRYIKAVKDTKLSNEELLRLPDAELEALLQPKSAPPPADERKTELDSLMPEIVRRLSKRYANVQLVYSDFYIKQCPQGYGYTQFKKYVKNYCYSHSYSYHNTYQPGEEWQIDFAGDPLYLTDRQTGESVKVVVLVCVMPYSQLPFMMALPNATTECFFNGLNKGLEYMGALPGIAKSDNMKQWVKKSDRYCPTLNDACTEWAVYYQIGVTACRVRRPRDKGPVESAVNQLYKFIYARIQDERHYTLSSLNNRIWQLLDEYNSLPYKGRTRWDIFNEDEKPNMRPLPLQMHRFKYRKQVRLTSTYHVCVGSEHHFYSVPYTYVGKTIVVMWDMELVEVFCDNVRVCVHDRSFTSYAYTTMESHMPERHIAYQKSRMQNAATLVERASFMGENIKWAVNVMLERNRFPQQAYNSCNALLALGNQYGTTRLENACAMMRKETSTASLKVVKNILLHNRDLREGDGLVNDPPQNENVRGAAQYVSITM